MTSRTFLFILIFIVLLLVLVWQLVGFIEDGGQRDDIRRAIIIGGLLLVVFITQYWLFFVLKLREPLGKILLLLSVFLDGGYNCLIIVDVCPNFEPPFADFYWHTLKWLSTFIAWGWLWVTSTKIWFERIWLAAICAVLWPIGLNLTALICGAKCW